MKILHITFGVCTALLLVLLPQSSEAYFTTAQTGTQFGETAAIYTIEYAFGLQKNDIYMPIVAERGLGWKSDAHKLGYTIHSEDGVSTNGTTAAIVLSNAPIVDGMYKIAKGTAQKMTLLVVFSTTDALSKENYTLQVDQLPYYVDKGETELKVLQLNPSELQYYVSPAVRLN